MITLSQKDIQYGFTYFHKEDLGKTKSIVEISEYGGEQELIINCTQLNTSYAQKEKKRILQEWCDFLCENTAAFKVLSFGTRMPQALFEAVCHQENLHTLKIKWGAYKDISAISNLKNLRLLHLGSGAGVENIEPITQLQSLIALSIENFQKITDYSALKALEHLVSLSIDGDGMSPQYIKIDELTFLKEMPQLRFLRILTARLQSKDYTPVLHLKNLEHLSLRSERNVKKIYAKLLELPHLKWGLLKERPANYL